MSSVPTNLPSNSELDQVQRPIVTLTAEQSESNTIELRNADGSLRGILVRDGGYTIFYSPERIAELRRLAANPGPVKPLREVLDNAMRIAREYHEWRGNQS
jgi:hypothetical protein